MSKKSRPANPPEDTDAFGWDFDIGDKDDLVTKKSKAYAARFLASRAKEKKGKSTLLAEQIEAMERLLEHNQDAASRSSNIFERHRARLKKRLKGQARAYESFLALAEKNPKLWKGLEGLEDEEALNLFLISAMAERLETLQAALDERRTHGLFEDLV